MRRLEMVKALERIAKGTDCDLDDSAVVNRLSGFKTEMKQFRLGSETYQELCEILRQAVSSFDRIMNFYVKEGRYLDLTEFFELGEAKPIVETFLDDNLDLLTDEEAVERLAILATYEPMERFIELLVGYPAYVPRGPFEEAAADPEFWEGRKQDYSYVVTVQNADIRIVRGTLEWLKEHAFDE